MRLLGGTPTNKLNSVGFEDFLQKSSQLPLDSCLAQGCIILSEGLQTTYQSTYYRQRKRMLKIGDFAWLSQVTVETLRHYDRLGLLKPIHLDQFTGYRYYSLDQLPRLNRILALKDLGLPLEEIGQMLDQEISVDEIRGILELKQVELKEQILEVQRRLTRVAARLKQIELEGKMPDFEVLLKTVKSQRIVSVRETISSWDQDVVGPTFTGMFDEVGEYLGSQGVHAAGPGIALYHHQSPFIQSGMEEEYLDVEAAIPIDVPMSESQRVKVRDLSENEVAYTVHHGDFSGLPLAKQALFAWLESNGYRRAGPIREIYLHFDPNHQANYDSPHHVTEVQFPVEKD
jgi:DNA-binding transcriptional MerR regulator